MRSVDRVRERCFIYNLPCKPGSAYINVTDACLNDCLFCIKRDGSHFYGSDLSLNGRDPEPQQIIDDLRAADVGSRLKEVVFCGMGEPLLRYDCVLEVCRAIRVYRGETVVFRVDTSGLTWRKNKRLDLLDHVDILSISLNAETVDKYNALCDPKIPDAYQILMDFLNALSVEERNRREKGMRFPEVRLSVIDTRETDYLPEIGRQAFPEGQFPVPDFVKCEAIASSFGWPLIIKRLFRDSRDDHWKNSEIKEMCFDGVSPDYCKDCSYRH